MEAFEIYLLKSVSLLSMLYITYWLMIRNGSYYSWNRAFLLLSLMISFLFPILNFLPQNIESNSYNFILEPLVVNPNFIPARSLNIFNTLSILTIIYIGGATYFCLRFISNIVRIYFLYFRFPKYKFNDFKAVILDSNQATFTFFNLLFISRSDFEKGNVDEIIVHEKAHRDQYHSIDIILLEIMTIFQWFNPFVWLFRLALKSEHEFIADNKVLKKGFDKIKYQKLLFEKALGITNLNLTNNFNYSLLKKRIKVMASKKSNSVIKIKYLLSVPTMLLIMILFAVNLNSYGQDETYSEVDVMAEYRDGGIAGMRKFVQQNIFYPKSALKDNISAIIYVQFDIDEKGNVTNVKINRSGIRNNEIEEVVVTSMAKKNAETTSKSLVVLEAEAIRLISSLKGFIPAQKDGKNVKSQFTFPISFHIQKTES